MILTTLYLFNRVAHSAGPGRRNSRRRRRNISPRGAQQQHAPRSHRGFEVVVEVAIEFVIEVLTEVAIEVVIATC